MTHVVSPATGEVKAISTASDPVFAEGAVGDGVAIYPDAQSDSLTVYAPVAGKAIRVMPHAFVIMTEDKKGILVHVGIDTVELKGEGFDVHAEQKSQVEVGQPMVTCSPAFITEKGLDPVILVVQMDSEKDSLSNKASGPTTPGEPLFTTA